MSATNAVEFRGNPIVGSLCPFESQLPLSFKRPSSAKVLAQVEFKRNNDVIFLTLP